MDVLQRVREATIGTDYEGRLYLVGGVLRDRLLGRPGNPDVDLVVEGDSAEVARILYEAGISDHAPVTYPRFGTARVQVSGVPIEIVSARSESYDPASRKPSVRRATLMEDILRRDFTINTLVESLHEPGIRDLTGRALADLRDGIIRTPVDPETTFRDDPLRMLRAIRFAVTLDFTIEASTWRAIEAQAYRIDLVGEGPRVVSAERVRDEFIKIMMARRASRGLELLREARLLIRFLPELCAMVGVTQNAWHAHDVWHHTMLALDRLDQDASLSVRLATLLHDVGKPVTRTEDERGVHFYDHQTVGAEMTREMLARLRFPADLISEVSELVRLHMRLGEVQPDWSKAAIRRLIREAGDHLDQLHALARADMAAMEGSGTPTDLEQVMKRIAEADAEMHVRAIVSPLDGTEIMECLGIGPGRVVGEAKEYLINAIIEGRLSAHDKEAARRSLLAWRAGAAS